MCECCLGARCVRSWISYGLKQVKPWLFICFFLFILTLCIPVHENYKHFLVWETKTVFENITKELIRNF